MAKITYENKVALNINSDIADINKCNATDLNEIKEVVNTNDDNTTTNTNDIANNKANIGTLSSLSTTNKSNLVSAINEINNKFNYSENEIVIGTWINGKKLYQKVVKTNKTFSKDATNEITHGINNVDFIFIVLAIIENASSHETWTAPITLYQNNTDTDFLNFRVNRTKITCNVVSGWGVGWNKYIVLNYTKTTD